MVRIASTAETEAALKDLKDIAMDALGVLEDRIGGPLNLLDWKRQLNDLNYRPDQVKLVVNRCRALLKVARVNRLSGISAEAVSNALAKLREKKANGKQGTSAQTSNHYLRAMKQFTR